MIPLFTPEPLEGPLVQPFWGKYPVRKGTIFYDQHLPQSFFDTGVEYVEAEKAKAIVLPNAFGVPGEREVAYIQKFADLGGKLGIPVFIFCPGDLTDQIRFDPRVYVFRQSVYRSTMQPADIVMPTLTEDFGDLLVLREKSTKPTISFCGQGGYNKRSQQIKYYIKVCRWKLYALSNPVLNARIVGVYWRRKMLQACTNSSLVTTLFIIRNSFSGAYRTIELDPLLARKEYIDSIVHSDFVLAPKGDGNYSNRFLEALSFGRIPVLLNTDTVLPLEDDIDYRAHMVTVPMEKVSQTPHLVREWYDAHDALAWGLAQQKAREVYREKLRLDSFFAYFFTTVVPRLPQCPQTSLITKV